MLCSEEPNGSEHTTFPAFQNLLVAMVFLALRRRIRRRTLGQAMEASEETDLSDPWDARQAEEYDAEENPCAVCARTHVMIP